MEISPFGLSRTEQAVQPMDLVQELCEIDLVTAFREDENLQKIFPFFFPTISDGAPSLAEARQTLHSIEEKVESLYSQLPNDVLERHSFIQDNDNRTIARDCMLLARFLEAVNEHSLNQVLNSEHFQTVGPSETIRAVEAEWFSPEWQEQCKDLIRGIIVSDCELLNIPKQFFDFPNLDGIILNNVGLSWLPPHIKTLGRLKRIHLQNNKFIKLPPELFCLQNLFDLRVSGNRLTDVPADIKNCSQLKILDLSENQIRFVSPEINRLKALQELYLQKNELRYLPPINNVISLKKLRLNDNYLRNPPQGVGTLLDLEALDLSKNQIDQLPQEIGQCTNLRHLDISNNCFTDFPEQVLELKNLDALYIEGNLFTSLPSLFIESPLPALQQIVTHCYCNCNQPPPPISSEALSAMLHGVRFQQYPVRFPRSMKFSFPSFTHHGNPLSFSTLFQHPKALPAAFIREYAPLLAPQRYALPLPRKLTVSLTGSRRTPPRLSGKFSVRHPHTIPEAITPLCNLRGLSLDRSMLTHFPQELRARLFQDT